MLLPAAGSSFTGAVLIALILTFGPISGAYFNPAVTMAEVPGRPSMAGVPGYVGAQAFGVFAGVAAANIMFGEPVFFASRHAPLPGACRSSASLSLRLACSQ